MEKIENSLEKAILMLTNIAENSIQKNEVKQKKPKLEWLPEQYQALYEKTDLLYSFCVKLFSMIEANMRENIPETTMRSWFIEFIKAGWTKNMLIKRYHALIRHTKYGTIDFASWVNAVPVYAEDEVNIIITRKIETIIAKGKYLIQNKDRLTELTEEDKIAIEVALVKEIEYEIKNEKLRKIDEYKQQKKERDKK